MYDIWCGTVGRVSLCGFDTIWEKVDTYCVRLLRLQVLGCEMTRLSAGCVTGRRRVLVGRGRRLASGWAWRAQDRGRARAFGRILRCAGHAGQVVRAPCG